MKRQLLLVGFVSMLLVACGGLGETSAGDVRPGPGDADATVVGMVDDAFEPTSLSVPAGQAVQFEAHNNGQQNHNFTSETLDVSTGPVAPGEVVTLTATVPAGTTQFVCTWHPGMVIQVTAA